MPRSLHVLVAVALAACADDAKETAGAAGMPDGAGILDASAPDAVGDGRAASVVDCKEVAGMVTVGLTAEVTDWGGYIPGGDATMPVGSGALWVYADGGTQHTITSGLGGAAALPDGLFGSEPFDQHGDRTCVLFEAPGTYRRDPSCLRRRPSRSRLASDSPLEGIPRRHGCVRRWRSSPNIEAEGWA